MGVGQGKPPELGEGRRHERPPGDLVTFTPDIEYSFLVVVLAILDNDHRKKVLLVMVIVRIEVVV